MRAARAGVAAQERSELGQLCRAGARIALPTGAAAAARRGDTARRLALATDRRAARVLEAMRKLPGAGPRPLASPLPAECTGAGAAKQSKPTAAAAAFPEGTYVTKVTLRSSRARPAPTCRSS